MGPDMIALFVSRTHAINNKRIMSMLIHRDKQAFGNFVLKSRGEHFCSKDLFIKRYSTAHAMKSMEGRSETSINY